MVLFIHLGNSSPKTHVKYVNVVFPKIYLGIGTESSQSPTQVGVKKTFSEGSNEVLQAELLLFIRPYCFDPTGPNDSCCRVKSLLFISNQAENSPNSVFSSKNIYTNFNTKPSFLPLHLTTSLLRSQKCTNQPSFLSAKTASLTAANSANVCSLQHQLQQLREFQDLELAQRQPTLS